MGTRQTERFLFARTSYGIQASRIAESLQLPTVERLREGRMYPAVKSRCTQFEENDVFQADIDVKGARYGERLFGRQSSSKSGNEGRLLRAGEGSLIPYDGIRSILRRTREQKRTEARRKREA